MHDVARALEIHAAHALDDRAPHRFEIHAAHDLVPRTARDRKMSKLRHSRTAVACAHVCRHLRRCARPSRTNASSSRVQESTAAERTCGRSELKKRANRCQSNSEKISSVDFRCARASGSRAAFDPVIVAMSSDIPRSSSSGARALRVRSAHSREGRGRRSGRPCVWPADTGVHEGRRPRAAGRRLRRSCVVHYDRRECRRQTSR